MEGEWPFCVEFESDSEVALQDIMTVSYSTGKWVLLKVFTRFIHDSPVLSQISWCKREIRQEQAQEENRSTEVCCHWNDLYEV